MKRTLMSAVALAFLLTLPRPAPAQDLASQLVGVWNLNSQVRKEVATGATSNSYGEKPIGRFIFTRGGHSAFTIVGTDRKAPASPTLTDAERIDNELFKTMSFGSGTNKVEGNKVVTRYDTSWHQLWTGRDISVQAEINGKTPGSVSSSVSKVPRLHQAGSRKVLPWPVARPDDDCRRGRGLAIQICNQRLAKSALDHIPD